MIKIDFENSMRVFWDGYDLINDFGLYNVSIEEHKPHILATNKNITTAKPMYGIRDVITGFSRDPITFNLTFSLLDKSFTSVDTFCQRLYSLFDVPTYKHLVFEDEGYDYYYNAMPYVGSASEMYLYVQNQGYVTIPFVCDAGHAWIDMTYKFSRTAENASNPWTINNPCNVIDRNGKCRVYPYITITIPEGTTYFSIRRKSEYDTMFENGQITEEERTEKTANLWFEFTGLTPNQTITLDNANQQLYSSVGDNLIEKMSKGHLRFFYLEGGQNTIYHRYLVINGERQQSYYDIEFNLSCPYMQ